MDSEKNAVKPRIDNYKYFNDELQDFKQARQYALENLSEIMKKEALIKHTKYSGYISGLGCISPSLIADKTIGGYKKGRFLKEIPAKGDYTVYHFDEHMNPIRFEMVFPGYSGTTYWFFEYKAKTYVMSFREYKEIYKPGSHAYKVEYNESGIHKYTHFDSDNSFLQEVYDYSSLIDGYITCERYSYAPTRINTSKSVPVGEEGSPIAYWRFHVYMTNDKVSKIIYIETVNGVNEEELIYDKDKFKKVSKMNDNEIKVNFNSWLDKVVENGFPDNAVALNFNLHEGTIGSYTIDLIASDYFDESDQDWACSEIFSTKSNSFNIYKSGLNEWKKALKYCTKLVNGYLSSGKQAYKLKIYKGIGIGFVDGDLDILYINK